jgi:PAS domain S-box-containing protein
LAKAEATRWWDGHRAVPLSWYLVAIISIATVPLAVFAAYLVLQQSRAAEAQHELSLRAAASAVALTVERDLATSTEVLHTFGEPDTTRRADREAIERELTRLLSRRADWIGVFLLDADGEVLVARGDDRALAIVNSPSLRQVRFEPASPRSAFQLLRLKVDQADLTAVAVPVTSARSLNWTLGAVFQPDKWQLLIDRQAPNVEGFVGIFDRDRRWIARASKPDGGAPGPAKDLLKDVTDPSRTQGVERVDPSGNAPVYVAWHGIGATGWGATVGLAAAPIDRQQRNSIIAAVAGGVLAFAIGLVSALIVSRGVTSPLARLAQGIRPRETDGNKSSNRSNVAEIERLTSALELAESGREIDRAALQAKADEFETLFQRTPVGLAVAMDRECHQVIGNAALAQLLGSSVDSDLSFTPDAAHPPACRFFSGAKEVSIDELPLRRAAQRGEETQGVEYTVVCRDGRTVQVLAYAAPLRASDGSTRGAVGAFIDLTERTRKDQHLRETQARLEASEQRVELAQEVGRVGFFEYDFVADTSVWTAGMGKLFGVDPVTFAGTFAAWLDLLDPGDAARLRAQLDAAIAARAPTVAYEFRTRTRDGGSRVLAGRALMMYSTEGGAQRMVGIAADITERHMSDRERAVLLEREQKARQEAEAANRSKDEFLATFSHELRNPLSAIAAATEVLNRIGRQQPDEIRARDVIKRQIHNLTRMMEDLLDVSRVVNGKVSLSRGPLDLAAVVQRAASALNVTGRWREHRLELDLAPVWINGDSVRIEQIASNLLTNAAKYTPEGGTIWVKVGVEGDQALLAVSDTGVGIHPDMLDRVFDMFVQGERGSPRRQGGLGVGLTLVRRLAEMHGGSVVASSAGLDQGSRFEVRFPRIPAPVRT